MTLTELNDKFAGEQLQFIEGPGGLTVARISNSLAEADIALHGAHVMSFVPKGQKPVLWMSESSWFEENKPIRGGIPVCWPWFGGHPTDGGMPSHGFARISEWQVEDTGTLEGGVTYIVLKLTENEIADCFKDFAFEARIRVEVGNELSVALIVDNTGSEKMCFSAALHSYFNVSDITNISIHGLDGREYIDTLDDTRHVQSGDRTFDAETDLVYLDTDDKCVIDDTGLDRRIFIDKEGSRSAVVWNPWIAKAQRMPDFGDDEYQTMVCVETTNAYNDARSLAPGEQHILRAIIGLENK
jgi:D-hexose-6-phosphate mutarotase